MQRPTQALVAAAVLGASSPASAGNSVKKVRNYDKSTAILEGVMNPAFERIIENTGTEIYTANLAPTGRTKFLDEDGRFHFSIGETAMEFERDISAAIRLTDKPNVRSVAYLNITEEKGLFTGEYTNPKFCSLLIQTHTHGTEFIVDIDTQTGRASQEIVPLRQTVNHLFLNPRACADYLSAQATSLRGNEPSDR